MRRILIVMSVIILIVLVLVWAVPWILNGGLPLSGRVGDQLPPHIPFVQPSDGEPVGEAHGFCVHFNYDADNGIGDERRTVIRYYLDGKNVTRQMVDVSTTEYGYPDPVGEPCYWVDEPLRPGWHTAKVNYDDIVGEQFSYTWRFFVAEPR